MVNFSIMGMVSSEDDLMSSSRNWLIGLVGGAVALTAIIGYGLPKIIGTEEERKIAPSGYEEGGAIHRLPEVIILDKEGRVIQGMDIRDIPFRGPEIREFGAEKPKPEADLEGRIEFNENDISSLSQALLADPKSVTKTLVEKWKVAYTTGVLRVDLENAIERSKDEIAAIKKIFEERGVPAKYAFLAIPESSWTNNTSRAGARGLFQLTEKTARSHGAIIKKEKQDGKYKFVRDDRLNHFKNARFAADNLKYLNDIFGDWNLTLAAYNSSKPWKYRKEVIKFGDGKLSYGNYLLFLASELRNIQDTYEKAKTEGLEITVKGGYSISLILSKYNIKYSNGIVEELAKYNGMEHPKDLKIGKKFKIPAKYFSGKVLSFDNEGWIRENLNYPPKLLAVLGVLSEKYPDYFNTLPSYAISREKEKLRVLAKHKL